MSPLALALLASWASAAPEPAPLDTFRARVDELRETVADPRASDGFVWEKAQDFAAAVPRTEIAVQTGLRLWDFGGSALGDGMELTAARLVAEGEARLRSGAVPPPEFLRDAVASAGLQHGQGRLGFDTLGSMDEEQMGRYRYVPGRLESGMIELNRRMSEIGAVIGRAFAYSTVAHEAAHRLAHEQGLLTPERVEENEVYAFRAQHDWLAWIDPHGERLPYARQWLRNQIRLGRGGSLAPDALRYLDHLAEVRETGGEEDKLRELVRRLGYSEGHRHGPADHPTRS